jgi:PAS domain S-box-containing protein
MPSGMARRGRVTRDEPAAAWVEPTSKTKTDSPSTPPVQGRTPLHRRLSARLAVIALLAAAPVTGLSLWTGLEARQDVVEQITQDGLSLARALAAQHRLAVEDGRRALAALTVAPGPRGRDGLCSFPSGGGQARPTVLAGLTLYAADLSVRCSSATAEQSAALRLAAERARAAGQIATGPAVSAAASGPFAEDRPLVPLAHPTTDGNIVAALLDPTWLSFRLTALLPSEDAMILVTDGARRVVATVPHRSALASTLLQADTLTDATGGTESIRIGGRAMLLSQAPLDGGLSVGVAVDRAAIGDSTDTALLRTGGGLALALLAGLLLALTAARFLVSGPVSRLAGITRTLVAGGVPARVGPPYTGTAELAEVERALDTLGERLSRHETALINSETQLSVKRQSEERFRALVELAPEAIVVEARGTVLYANSRAVDLFGADGLEDLLAVPFADQMHPDDREEVRQRLRDANSAGAVGVAEVRVRRLGGEELLCEVVVGPIAYAGRPAAHIMIRDITDSRLARRRLRESEERFRALVESAPDLIVTHHRGHIVLANSRAASVLFGENDAKAVIGRSIFDIVDDDDRPIALARLQEVEIAPRPLQPVDMALKRADGRRMICQVATSPVTYEGQPCLHSILRDVTTQRADQVNVAQSAKLATLGELAAGMAHELAQPMNIIRMAAEAALLGLDSGRDSEPGRASGLADRDRLELIATQAGRMGEIIDHMRVFTRRDTGPEERFDAAEAARRALAMIDHGLRGDGVIVSVDLPAAGTACVRGRPVQLEQVILNLLTNARDAVMERVQAGNAAEDWRPQIHVSGAVQGANVVLRVTDTGVGVPEHLRDRVFDPFVTSKAAGIGTGLGLSISDGLIRAMKGTITLDAAPAGGGAVFVVTLPFEGRRDDPCPCAPPPDRAGPSPLPRPAPVPINIPSDDEDGEASALVAHVLVADDETEAATLMADFLRCRGHRVSVAHDGLSAIDLFMEDPADILVTDLRMPGCDGRNLIASLRKHVPELPVVVVTGHVGAREARGLETDDQVAAVLRKPVSLQRMADLVDTLFADNG